MPEIPRLPMQPRVRKEQSPPEAGERANEPSLQSFWHWFAVAVLLFCWIAEASLCAERGF